MSHANVRRSRVVLQAGAGAGMSPGDRATLARLLLERGLEVSYRQETAGRPDTDAPAGDTVVVEEFGAAILSHDVSPDASHDVSHDPMTSSKCTTSA